VIVKPNPKPKPPLPGGEVVRFFDSGPQSISPNATRVKLLAIGGDGGDTPARIGTRLAPQTVVRSASEAHAWAAGFFEGEGRIAVTKDFTLHARVSQVDPEPLKKLKLLFGGRNKKVVGSRKAAQEWCVVNSHAMNFLSSIEKFVVRERLKEKIELARRFLAAKAQNVSTGRAVRDNALQEFFEAFQRFDNTGLTGSEETGAQDGSG